MLTSRDYLKVIENLLNANTEGKQFKLYADIGNYTEALRSAIRVTNGVANSSNDVVEYTNGIISLTPSELIPIKNLSMSTTVVDVEFAICIDREPAVLDDEGNVIAYPEVEKVRAIWDKMAQATNGVTTTLVDADNKSYESTLTFTLANTGLVSMLSSDTGEVLPISATVTFTTVENGVSSNNAKIKINGEELFVNEAVVTRTRIADQIQHINEESVKTVILQNGLGIDFSANLLDTDFGDLYLNDLMYGDSQVLLVEANINSKSGVYLMTFGNDTATLTAGLNIGANVSLVEVDWLAIERAGWQIVNANVVAGGEITISDYDPITHTNVPFPVGTKIIWDKKTLETTTEVKTSLKHTYNKDYNGKVYIKRGA